LLRATSAILKFKLRLKHVIVFIAFNVVQILNTSFTTSWYNTYTFLVNVEGVEQLPMPTSLSNAISYSTSSEGLYTRLLIAGRPRRKTNRNPNVDVLNIVVISYFRGTVSLCLATEVYCAATAQSSFLFGGSTRKLMHKTPFGH
jgi:hypothetical protein